MLGNDKKMKYRDRIWVKRACTIKHRLIGLSENYGYHRQEPRGVIRTVLQHNITVLCVYDLFLSFVDIIHGYAEDMWANFHWKCLLVKLSARNLHCYIFI